MTGKTFTRPRRLVLLALLGAALLAAITWLARTRNTTEQVRIEADWSTDESGARFIAGTVTNTTRESYAHLQVDITLFDSTGARVGHTVATTLALEPGDIWEFRAPVSVASATGFRIESIGSAIDPPAH